MMAVYDDGKYRFPLEIVKGTISIPRVIKVCGMLARLHDVELLVHEGYVFSYWLDTGIGFRIWSRDLHAVEGPESDFTVLGLSNDH